MAVGRGSPSAPLSLEPMLDDEPPQPPVALAGDHALKLPLGLIEVTADGLTQPFVDVQLGELLPRADDEVLVVVAEDLGPDLLARNQLLPRHSPGLRELVGVHADTVRLLRPGGR